METPDRNLRRTVARGQRLSPVCPYCNRVLMRTCERDERGEWVIRYVCACRPTSRDIEHAERKEQYKEKS